MPLIRLKECSRIQKVLESSLLNPSFRKKMTVVGGGSRCNLGKFSLPDTPSTPPSFCYTFTRFELEQFETGLSLKPQAIIGNKIDEKDGKINLLKLRSFLEEENSDVPLIPISGRDLINAREFLIALKLMVDD